MAAPCVSPLLAFAPSFRSHALTRLSHHARGCASLSASPRPRSSTIPAAKPRITLSLLTHHSPPRLRLFSSSAATQVNLQPDTQAKQPSTEPAPAPAPAARIVPNKPFSIKPYLALSRIDKPIGTWLLFWPCAWSITLAAHTLGAPLSTPVFYTLLFGLGALVMRGAGCTINDMWDANMDRQVQRTRSRPLAAGDLTHFQALCFLGVQLSAGLAVLVNLNWYSILLGASSLSLVTLYPLMKRITYWPQFVLGLTFNWGALLGWSALAGSVNWTVAVPLYAGSLLWTLVYDTIYAHQDKTDDLVAGVKSTALLFGRQTKPVLSAFSAGTIGLFGLAASRAVPPHTPSLLLHTDVALLDNHPIFTLSLAAAAAHLAWQIRTVNLDDRADCWAKFVSNARFGSIIFAGLAADYALWLYLEQQQVNHDERET